MTRHWSTLLLALLLASGTVAEEIAGLVLVAHPEVPVETISSRELRRIYLGKSTRWSGGQAIRPVMLESDAHYSAFVTEALEHSEENFAVYWKRMVFTGKGRPPRTFATADELAFYVRMTPGAIGYLPRGADLAGLKMLTLH